jgi:hypothetical protein
VLDLEAFSVSLVPVVTNCRLFQENKPLIPQLRYEVRSRVSVDSFRAFVGTEPDITIMRRIFGSSPTSSSFPHSRRRL